MEYLGTPFAWSIFVVLAIAVAAAMIVYGIHAFRKDDEPDPLFAGVSGCSSRTGPGRGRSISTSLLPKAHPLSNSYFVSRKERS